MQQCNTEYGTHALNFLEKLRKGYQQCNTENGMRALNFLEKLRKG